jgi:hypothetical protein
MTDRESTLTTMMRAADPVDPERFVRDVDLDAAWAQFNRRLTDAGPARVRPRLPRLVRGLVAGPRARFGTAAAAAVATAVAVIAMLAGPTSRNPLGPAAARAAMQPTTIAPAGDYYYVDERMFGFGPQSTNEQWWLAGDGSGRLVVTNRGRSNPIHGTSTQTFGPGRFGSVYGKAPGTWEAPLPDPHSVPNDPTALRKQLESQWQHWVDGDPSQRGAPDGTPEGDYLLPTVALLLQDPQLSPQVRSALFTVAGELPGITVRQNVTDVSGQTGEAISAPVVSTAKLDAAQTAAAKRSGQRLPNESVPRSDSPFRFQVIFNPATTQILAWENLTPGYPTSGVTFTNPGIVSSDTTPHDRTAG